MKKTRMIAVMVLFILLSSCGKKVSESTEDKLVGTWVGEQLTLGGTRSIETNELRRDGGFTQKGTVFKPSGPLDYTLEGTWRVADGYFYSTITESIPPGYELNTELKNKLLELNESEYSISRSGGRVVEYRRETKTERNGGLFWATNRRIDGLGVGAWKVGGNSNVRLVPPGLVNKGGIEATYILRPSESALFRPAYGFDFNWNPYQWWKGAVGQRYYRSGPATWQQRAGELGKAGLVTGGGIGVAIGLDEVFGD